MRKIIFAGIVGIIVIGVIALFGPLRFVESGYSGVLTKFGSVDPAPLDPGAHLILPIYENVHVVSTQPHTATSNETAATHDLQNVATTVSVTFHVNASDVPWFYQNFRDFSTVNDRIIVPNISNDVKAVTADYDAEELVTKREIVDNKVKEMVIQSLRPYHLVVEAVNVANFAFSAGYEKAIEDKQVAQQQALQAQYVLQQTKINAQQQVVQAHAAADAAVARAEGHAKSIMVEAQAQAKANDLLNSSLTPSVLQAKALDKWSGHLPTFLSDGAPLPFLGTMSAPAETARK